MISVSDLNKNKELSDKYFSAMEDEMDKNHNEPHWLKNEKVAGVIMDSLFFRNNIQYKLFSSSIMSNHVHIVISPLPNSPSLNVILQNHKKFTAIQCNKILERNGQFWEEESFDTLIRDNNHFNNCIIYTLNNPVNSDLVKYWRDWPWTYIDPQLLENGRY